MPYPHIMIDIEALGTTPGSAILSIGAVPFLPKAQFMAGPPFYAEIRQYTCLEVGLTEDPETVAWWKEQSDDVFELIQRTANCHPGPEPLTSALTRFTKWLQKNQDKDTQVWCKGPSFDFAILAAAYRACGKSIPWQFRSERDMRTITALPFATEKISPLTPHHALHDAIAQAQQVAATLVVVEGLQNGN